jgi:hypothetical protein
MLSQQLFGTQTKDNKMYANEASPNHFQMPLVSCSYTNTETRYLSSISR